MPKLIQPKQQEKRSFSFYRNTKLRLIEEFSRIQKQYDITAIVLVLDLSSAKIISGLFTVTQLVQYRIMFVERLEVVRKVLPHHAIYFITPNEQSIAAMLKDYQNEKQPQYKKAHVLLTDGLEEGLMKDIGKSRGFMKKLARHSFKEFYCQLSIISDNCLHMDLPYFSYAYSKQNSKEKECRVLIGKRFVHMAAGYQNLHTVRFLYDKTTANKVAERVIQRASKQIRQYLMKLLDSKSHAIDPNASDLTIFVVDRSVDAITPIIHGYSYESLLYDILNQGGKHRQEYAKLPKNIFDEFRYRHISHALQELPKRLDTLLQKTSKPGSFDPLELKKLIEEKEQLNIHVELLHHLFQKYQQKNLTQIGELELCLATGVTQDGKQTSSSELLARIVSEIKNNKVLSQQQLLRLALLALICIKLTKQNYMMLLSLFSQEHKKILINLNALGITYDKKVSKSTKNIDKSTMERTRQLLQQKNIPSERFQSALQITLPRLINLLKRDQKGQDRKTLGEIVVSVSPDKMPPKFDEERLVLFMCGGLSPTEICNIRRDHTLDSILLATDTILTPEDFVNSLSKVDILDQ